MGRILEEQTIEGKLLGALLAFDLMKGMLTAGFWIYAPNTMIAKVASLSNHPTAISYIWMLLALLVLPYFCLQTFNLWSTYHREITRLACRALLASGVMWAYLSYLSKDIDSANITGVLVMHSLINVVMSGILASSINTAQREEAKYQTEPEESKA